AALDRLARGDGRHAEATLGVEGSVCLSQSKTAARQHAQTAPGPVAHFVHFRDGSLGGGIARTTDGAGVLVVHLESPGFELRQKHEDAFEQIDRLEARHDDGNAMTTY